MAAVLMARFLTMSLSSVGDELGEPVHHLLAFAKLVFVVEISNVNDALKLVLLRQSGDDLVDPVADFLIALELDHVGKRAAFGYMDQGIGVPGVFVGDVFDEKQGEHKVLVLGCIHPAAQLVAALPEGGVEFGFF